MGNDFTGTVGNAGDFVAWPVSGAISYMTVSSADAYFASAIHASDWTSATDETKENALVSSTRTMDRQRWQGEKTEDDQDLQWPRTGVTDRYGDEVDDSTLPDDFLAGVAEYALDLIQNTSLQDNSSTGSNTKSLKAGSAEIEYFKSTKGTAFPTIVQDYVSQYFGSGSAVLGSWASGTDASSSFTSDTDYDLTRGWA